MNNLVMNWNDIRVGDTIHNDNGDDYVVLAINPKEDRTLLVKKNTNEPFYVGAWALQKYTYGLSESYFWSQGHYFMDDLNAAVDYVMNAKEKVYTVHRQDKFDYDFSVEDTKHGCFRNRNDALNTLNKLANKMREEFSDDIEEWSEENECDEDSGLVVIEDDIENGFYSIRFGFEQHYEVHTIWIEEWEVK